MTAKSMKLMVLEKGRTGCTQSRKARRDASIRLGECGTVQTNTKFTWSQRMEKLEKIVLWIIQQQCLQRE
jgi:hypothetical protein